MTDSLTQPPEAVINAALEYLVTNRGTILAYCDTSTLSFCFGIKKNEEADNVKNLMFDKYRLRCNGSLIMSYLEDYAAIVGDTTKSKEVIEVLMEIKLGELKRILADSKYVGMDPVDTILDVATTKVFGCCHVFLNNSLHIAVTGRHIKYSNLIETQLSRSIRAHILGRPTAGDLLVHTDKTIIVGGPSGGGKTVSLLAQSQTFKDSSPQVVVAYLDPPHHLHFPMKPDTSLQREPKDRLDADVMSYLVGQLLHVVPRTAFEQLPKVTRAKPLQFLVVVDEVGGGSFLHVVKALCSIKPSTIHERLARDLRTKYPEIKIPQNCFPNVTFRLAAAGTGIGVSETEKVGASPETYQLFSAFDGEPKSNEEFTESNFNVFKTYFFDGRTATELDIEKFKLAHPLTWAMISENARMAAIVGSDLKSLFYAFNSYFDRVKLLHMFDHTQFLGHALFAFKGLNRLDGLGPDGLWVVLLKVVRMHWFPTARARGMDEMQTTFGLIFDRNTWRTGQEALNIEEGGSTMAMPTFSASLLGMLCGNRVITQSITSGASLEEYTLSLTFLLACAACDSKLFLAALDTGKLRPLVDTDVKQLFPANDLSLQCIVHDFQGDFERSSDPKGLVAAVAKAIEHFSEKQDNKELHHVAAFRSFGLQFADMFIIINDTMILVQANECPDVYQDGEALNLERRKMGSGDPAATEAKCEVIIRSLLDVLRLIIDNAKEANIGAAHAAKVYAGTDELEKYYWDAKPKKGAKSKEEAKSRVETLVDNLTTMLSKNKSLTKATRGELKKLIETAEAKMYDDLPQNLLKELSIEWRRKTGKMILNIYRCFVTPKAMEKAIEPSRDSYLRIEKGWAATLHGKDRFVSVELVKFLKFDPNGTRQPPYEIGKLPLATLLLENDDARPNSAVEMKVAEGNDNAKVEDESKRARELQLPVGMERSKKGRTRKRGLTNNRQSLSNLIDVCADGSR